MAIEYAKSKTKIFVPSQWDTILTMARRKNPYQVVPLKFYDFLDYKGMKVKSGKGLKAESGKRAMWNTMRWMRFLKSDPRICLFKYAIDESDFERVKLVNTKQQGNDLKRLYKNKLPISSAKKKDLVALCKQSVCR